MQASLNYDKLLDYLKTTQRSWKLFMGEYPKTAAQYKATCKALKESTTVEKLKFLYSAECKEEFIDALRFNTSLKILEIHGLREAEETAQVLYALASKQHLINFNLHDNAWNDASFRALIAFVKNNKIIRTLFLPRASWTADQLTDFLATLKTCPNLVKLHLGDLFLLDAVHLAPLVEYLNSTPTIHSFLAELDADHLEYLEGKLIKPLQDYRRGPDTALPRTTSTDDEPLTLPGTALNNFWNTLPTELTKHILYDHLNIRDITRFMACSKVTLELTRRWKVWKEYYLKHFSCVTAETLELINVMEGWALLNKTSASEVWPKDPWQLILKYTFTAHSQNPRDFPRDRNPLARRLVEPVYQLYPQLIGCASATFEPNECSEEALGISNPSIHYTWFGTISSHTYSLGFELLRDGTINAIMLYHYNSQDSTKDGHWNFVHYVFDWFTTKSVAEFQTKLKPLVEILLTAQESSNYHLWPSNYRNTIRDMIENLRDKVTSVVRTEFNDKIAAEAKSIVQKCNPNPERAEEFAEMLYEWCERVKQCGNDVVVPDFISLKQVVTPKTVVNEQWAHAPVRSHYPNIGEENYKQYWARHVLETPKLVKFRPKKRSGPTAVVIFTRTVINLIVMPLLKSFWPRDLGDPNYRVYSNFKGVYEYEQTMYHLYQKLGYTSLEHVSVSHAHPQAWPIIAVAAAQLIISPLCRMIEAVIARTWTSKQQQQQESAVQSRDEDDQVQTRLDELTGALTRIGLIPTEHITMIKKLFEELSKC